MFMLNLRWCCTHVFSLLLKPFSSRQLLYLIAITLMGEYIKRRIDITMKNDKLISTPFIIVIELTVEPIRSSFFRGDIFSGKLILYIFNCSKHILIFY